MADLVNPVDRREAIVLGEFGGYYQRGPEKSACDPPAHALLLGTPVQCAQAGQPGGADNRDRLCNRERRPSPVAARVARPGSWNQDGKAPFVFGLGPSVGGSHVSRRHAGS